MFEKAMNWIAICCLAVCAIVQAFDQAVKNSDFAELPFYDTDWWNYLPLALLIVAGFVFLTKLVTNKTRFTTNAQKTETPMFSHVLETIVDRQYVNLRVDLDGKRFVRCEFKNISFFYNGKGACNFVDCKFAPNSMISLETEERALDEFARLISFLQTMPNVQRTVISEHDREAGRIQPLGTLERAPSPNKPQGS